MQQPTPAATPAPSATPPAAPAATLTRTDGVVSGNAPAMGTNTGTTQPGGAAVPAQPPQGPGSNMTMVMFMMPLLLVAVWWFGSRAEKKRRAEMSATLASLQRNDKVQTVGGMIGSIAEINDTEVILHVDEITKTRVRVSRSAITSVLNRGPAKGDGIKATA